MGHKVKTLAPYANKILSPKSTIAEIMITGIEIDITCLLSYCTRSGHVVEYGRKEVFIVYSDFEKSLYAKIFKEFQKENYHYEFPIPNDPEENKKLVDALTHLDEGGVLIFFEDSGTDDTYMVELQYDYAYDFVEL